MEREKEGAVSMAVIKRALVSVSDKRGVVELARGLKELGVEIVSTGGTEKKLREEGVEVIPISEVTGFVEMLDGRVKTLHPHVHGAILADRSKPEHLRQLEGQGIKPIDLVVVNLYPFRETVAHPSTTLEEAVEQIDIGGVALIRAAAKNFHAVAVVTNPSRYGELLEEMGRGGGEISLETRKRLAAEGFRHTSDYDTAICSYLAGGGDDYPETLSLSFFKQGELRYGENPHQRAALYRESGAPAGALIFAEQLQGKALSFNNMLDLDAAWALVREFEEPAAAIIKHNTPCGAAVAATAAEAYARAFDSDPLSSFGGIVAFNREVDAECAARIVEVFQEAVIAPSYTPEALETLSRKADLRLMRLPLPPQDLAGIKDYKRLEGGLLVQDYDRSREGRDDFRVVTSRQPSEEEWRDLLFAWKAAKHVRSNAIVLARDLVTVGIGAGQLSRVDAVWVALHKAGDKAAGCVLGSDAFFPFPDALEAAAQAGVTCFAEPGGSLKDEEVKAAAERLGVSLVFTGYRHFRH
jgi:phosphoribosylaminoimidazolecarboxamide formyltransferase/IMP cyclohydrolase